MRDSGLKAVVLRSFVLAGLAVFMTACLPMPVAPKSAVILYYYSAECSAPLF
jgi:hypothetical protein